MSTPRRTLRTSISLAASAVVCGLRKTKPAMLAAVIGCTSLAPNTGYAGGFIADMGRAVGLEKPADWLDKKHAEVKNAVPIYGDAERGVSRIYNESFRWIKRHPTEAAMVALLVVTAGAACADGCTVMMTVYAVDAGGGVAAVGIPIAIYEGDRRDKAAKNPDNVDRERPAQNSSKPDASHEPAPTSRTKEEVQARLKIMPELGKMPKGEKRYTVVPGLTEYRTLNDRQREELGRNLEASKTMPTSIWLDHVWRNGKWDYKNQTDWRNEPDPARFGNINFGATGNVMLYWDRLIFLGGGLAQVGFGESRKIYDPKHGSPWDFFSPRVPNDSLFGDRPEDHVAVKGGIDIHEHNELIRTLEGESPFSLSMPPEWWSIKLPSGESAVLKSRPNEGPAKK